MRSVLVSLAAMTLLGTAPAQKPLGWRSAKFANPSDKGAKILHAVVHYPAKDGTKKPRNASFAGIEKSLPVIVFLHGFGATGGVMFGVAQHFAGAGYVVVLTNTTRTDRKLQAINARAFFAALKKENERKESFFRGKLDMTRAGLSGHSMGGGNTVRVLGDNPGYKAGFCFAPWTTPGAGVSDYVKSYAGKIAVPIAIVHGIKDNVLPWRKNAMDLYETIATDRAFKSIWVLGEQATHVNVAVPPMFRRKPDPTFVLCAELATAFFDRFLKGRKDALDAFVDPKKKPEGVKELRVDGPKPKAPSEGKPPGKSSDKSPGASAKKPRRRIL